MPVPLHLTSLTHGTCPMTLRKAVTVPTTTMYYRTKTIPRKCTTGHCYNHHASSSIPTTTWGPFMCTGHSCFAQRTPLPTRLCTTRSAAGISCPPTCECTSSTTLDMHHSFAPMKWAEPSYREWYQKCKVCLACSSKQHRGWNWSPFQTTKVFVRQNCVARQHYRVEAFLGLPML